MELDNLVKKLREKITEYRYEKHKEDTSIHVNAIEIALCLTEYAIIKNRKILSSEKCWFEAGWEIIQVFENSEWEDIIKLYHQLVQDVTSRGYFKQ